MRSASAPLSRAPALPLALALLLAAGHLALSLVEWARPARPATTYVFTPLVDVWPEGPSLSAAEGQKLGVELRHGIDAREISQAYARMGSTLSLAELLEGVRALEAEGRLEAEQRAELSEVLLRAQADHAALVELQGRILDGERAIAARVSRLRGAGPTPAGPR